MEIDRINPSKPPKGGLTYATLAKAGVKFALFAFKIRLSLLYCVLWQTCSHNPLCFNREPNSAPK